MLKYVLVSYTSWIIAIKSEHDGIMTLEFFTMLERIFKSYKQETKKSKWNHKPQFTIDKCIIFWKVILNLFWKYFSYYNKKSL